MNIPSISGHKLVNCLVKKFGFQIARQKGSHIILQHQDGRTVTIPCHQGEDLSKGLFIKIIKKEVQIPVKEFLKILQLLLVMMNNNV